MTEPVTTTKTERRRTARILREQINDLKAEGDRKIHSRIPAVSLRGYKAHDIAHAIGVALGYMERCVNLATGELTISLDEPEEMA